MISYLENTFTIKTNLKNYVSPNFCIKHSRWHWLPNWSFYFSSAFWKLTSCGCGCDCEGMKVEVLSSFVKRRRKMTVQIQRKRRNCELLDEFHCSPSIWSEFQAMTLFSGLHCYWIHRPSLWKLREAALPLLSCPLRISPPRNPHLEASISWVPQSPPRSRLQWSSRPLPPLPYRVLAHLLASHDGRQGMSSVAIAMARCNLDGKCVCRASPGPLPRARRGPCRWRNGTLSWCVRRQPPP